MTRSRGSWSAGHNRRSPDAGSPPSKLDFGITRATCPTRCCAGCAGRRCCDGDLGMAAGVFIEGDFEGHALERAPGLAPAVVLPRAHADSGRLGFAGWASSSLFRQIAQGAGALWIEQPSSAGPPSRRTLVLVAGSGFQVTRSRRTIYWSGSKHASPRLGRRFLNCSKAEQEIQGFESNYWMCCVRRQKP